MRRACNCSTGCWYVANYCVNCKKCHARCGGIGNIRFFASQFRTAESGLVSCCTRVRSSLGSRASACFEHAAHVSQLLPPISYTRGSFFEITRGAEAAPRKPIRLIAIGKFQFPKAQIAAWTNLQDIYSGALFLCLKSLQAMLGQGIDNTVP
jgi:hypothetical protein